MPVDFREHRFLFCMALTGFRVRAGVPVLRWIETAGLLVIDINEEVELLINLGLPLFK